MEEIEYKLIVSIPTLLFALGSFIVLFVLIVCKPKNCSGNNMESFRRRKVSVTNTLPVFVKTKADNCGRTRPLKDIDITDDKASSSQTLCTFLYLFLLLFGGVASLFFQFLLLDISYNLPTYTDFRLLFHAADISHSCEQNGTAKECFEYDAWNKVNRNPIDCNSTEIQYGTIDVICYKIVFNIGSASGASYVGFKLPLVVLNVATSAVVLVALFKLYLMVFLRKKGSGNRGT